MGRDARTRELAALERAAVKRRKELAREMKEQAKLSALEQARLEVEAFEADLAVLLSVHKEASPQTNWLDLLWNLPPHPPREQNPEQYEEACAQLMRMRGLARRVLAREAAAYVEAIQGHSAFHELTALGSSITFQIEAQHVLECHILVRGREAIPTEQKSLTTTGKLSVKSMPKARFHEIYQDYVCSCVLRVVREVFALLPVDLVIVTAAVAGKEDRAGASVETPVLSVAIRRAALLALDFDALDPSDAIEGFTHRGDVMASRKSGEFVAVVPLKPGDVVPSASPRASVEELLTQVREMRGRLSSLAGAVRPPASPPALS